MLNVVSIFWKYSSLEFLRVLVLSVEVDSKEIQGSLQFLLYQVDIGKFESKLERVGEGVGDLEIFKVRDQSFNFFFGGGWGGIRVSNFQQLYVDGGR